MDDAPHDPFITADGREMGRAQVVQAEAAGIAPDVRIPLPLPEVLTDNVDTWTLWVAEDMKTEKRKE